MYYSCRSHDRVIWYMLVRIKVHFSSSLDLKSENAKKCRFSALKCRKSAFFGQFLMSIHGQKLLFCDQKWPCLLKTCENRPYGSTNQQISTCFLIINGPKKSATSSPNIFAHLPLSLHLRRRWRPAAPAQLLTRLT